MRFFITASCIVCVAFLSGCGKPAQSAGGDADQQRIAAEKTAEQLSQQHERDVAKDEQQRLLELKAAASTPAPAVAEAPVPQTPAAAPATPDPEQAPAQEISYQQFYDALSPYGSWLQLPSYGYVFQPTATVQDSNWRPYTQGHWAYTDDGWTWVSAEPFGWIAYHYGRWMRTHTLGWVWVPGDEWAPAWVSWRYGGDFVGWAPLPPEAGFNPSTGIQQWADQQYSLGPDDYIFVPASAFGEEDMSSVAEPIADNTPIYDDSNNETNIYYDAVNYVIICYGPSYDFMRSKCRRPLPPPLALHRGGFPGHGERGNASISGTSLFVSAPRIVGGRTAVPPKLRGTLTDRRLTSPVRPTASNGYNAPQPEHPIVSQPRDQRTRGANRPPQPPQVPNQDGSAQPPVAAAPPQQAAPGQQAPPPPGRRFQPVGRQPNQPPINQPPPPPPPGRTFNPQYPAADNAPAGTAAPGNTEQPRQRIIREQQAQQAQQQSQQAQQQSQQSQQANQAEQLKAAQDRQAAEQIRAAQIARQQEAAQAQQAARAEAAAAARAQAAAQAAQAAQAGQGASVPAASPGPAGAQPRGRQQ